MPRLKKPSAKPVVPVEAAEPPSAEPKGRQLMVVLISGNSMRNQFMRGADLCPRYKSFAEVDKITLTLKPGCTDERAMADLMTIMGHKELGSARRDVVAMFVPFTHEYSYVHPDIAFISDGTKEVALAGVLQRMGYVFEGSPETFHDQRLRKISGKEV